jgi:hypothetical protein
MLRRYGRRRDVTGVGDAWCDVSKVFANIDAAKTSSSYFFCSAHQIHSLEPGDAVHTVLGRLHALNEPAAAP